jgi:chemotaxis protein histidine kinase CheA
MTTADELVAKELARLSANFVAQLPEQLQAVEEGVYAWLDAPRDSGHYHVVSHRVHQLKGSGSTFGCPGISSAAQALERHIGAYRRELDAGTTPERRAVESAMAELQNEATRVRTRPQDPEAGR